jgi:hypothetical protein
MGKSIGNSGLIQRMKERMVELLCEKNDRLCDGKCVKAVNRRLMKVYNYWSLFTACNLTDDEVNCINNDIGNSIPKVISVDLKPTPTTSVVAVVESEPEPVYDTLTCGIDKLYYNSPTYVVNFCEPGNAVYDGSLSYKLTAYGGAAPYTYQWTYSCGTPSGELCYIDNATIDANWGLTGLTTDTVVGSTISTHYVIFTCVVTDSLGNTCQKQLGTYTKSLYE